jgi:transposase
MSPLDRVRVVAPPNEQQRRWYAGLESMKIWHGGDTLLYQITGLNVETNAKVFAGYIEQCLVPELESGAIVIMDNLPAHKSLRVTQAIEAVGCLLVYLPPFSPDLNPIENMWSKVKALLRKAAARSFENVIAAVGQALLAVTTTDCQGCFSHCGYDATST